METFCVPFDALSLDRAELFRTLGYTPDAVVDPTVAEQLEQILTEISRICQPRFGIALLPSEGETATTIRVGETVFTVGTLIASCLKDASHFALFVATAGEEFACWTEAESRKGDVFRAFLIDAVGSEIAEATARQAAQHLSKRVAPSGMHAGNSYSPGYCGWNVREQRKLFALLPQRPCGITLSESCLMHPIKSVSGIIPVGEHIQKQPYGCEICNNPNCYKKRKR